MLLAAATPRAIVVFGAYAAVLLVLATTVAQFVDYELFDLRIRALDSNTHASVFGAISLLTTAAAAAAAFALARKTRSREAFVLGVLISLLLVLRVANPPHVAVLSLPVTGATFVLLLREAEPRNRSGTRALYAGCLLLAVSLAIHVAAPTVLSRLGDNGDTFVYQVKGVLKHGAELAGWVFVAAALLSLRASAAQGRALSGRAP